MKTKLLLTNTVLMMSLITFSCDKIDAVTNELTNVNCDETWTAQVKPELDALTNTAAVFQNNPNKANCEGFRTAAQNYFDALEAAEECIQGSQLEAYDIALEEAKTELENFDCSDL